MLKWRKIHEFNYDGNLLKEYYLDENNIKQGISSEYCYFKTVDSNIINTSIVICMYTYVNGVKHGPAI